MAKKRTAKKSARKSSAPKKRSSPKTKKSPAKKASRKSSLIKKSGRRSSTKKEAGTLEVVKPPMVDVTPEVKKDVIEVKPEKPQAQEPKAPPVEKHEEFQKALTQEPKKGFWARLFGK